MRLRTRIAGIAVVAALALAPATTASAAFPGANGDIAFGRSSQGQVDIWVVFPGVTGTARLTNTPNRDESMPDWNAAGTRLAYTRCAGSKLGNCDIFTMDADGSDVTRLTATPNVQETWPAWSPDGTQIAYTSNADDSFQDIWVMDDDGANQTRLTPVEGFDAFPEWSPDGTKIAFSSDRAALDDIWVIDADGGNPTRLTAGPRIDERPDWSPDGMRIVVQPQRGDLGHGRRRPGRDPAHRHAPGRVRAGVLPHRRADRVQPARQRRPDRRVGDEGGRHRPRAADVREDRLLPGLAAGSSPARTTRRAGRRGGGPPRAGS